MYKTGTHAKHVKPYRLKLSVSSMFVDFINHSNHEYLIEMIDLGISSSQFSTKDKASILKRAAELGYTSLAWNVMALGSSSSVMMKPIDKFPFSVRPEVNGSTTTAGFSTSVSDICQFLRITVTVDDILDAHKLISSNESIKSFDIVACRPGNFQIFEYVCKSADVDIITFELSTKLPFILSKGLLDIAVNRGIYFEVVYSSLLSVSNKRQQIVANAKTLIKYLRGRNLILSSGADAFNLLRGPMDVVNIGRVLHLTQQQASRAVGENCVNVINHAKNRRLRYIPLEIVNASDAFHRYPWLRKKLEISNSVWNSSKDLENESNEVYDEDLSSEIVLPLSSDCLNEQTVTEEVDVDFISLKDNKSQYLVEEDQSLSQDDLRISDQEDVETDIIRNDNQIKNVNARTKRKRNNKDSMKTMKKKLRKTLPS